MFEIFRAHVGAATMATSRRTPLRAAPPASNPAPHSTTRGRHVMPTSLRFLGTAQDGGLPQFGCRCARCQAARLDPTRRRTAAAVLLTDDATGYRLLIDPSPDLARQYDALPPGSPSSICDAVAITHVHWGHWIGLGLFGREVSAAQGLPVFATPAVHAFLREHQPARLAFELGHLRAEEVPAGTTREAGPFALHAHAVVHRSEFADVVAWRVTASDRPRGGLLYCPDIDRWTDDVVALATACDVALVDATFGSPDELPGRDLATIPHPLARTTMAALAPAVAAGTRVGLIHLNHSNPLADADSDLRRDALAQGFVVPADGDEWTWPAQHH
ncbi:MAG: MBL fold metallo-hydrolase [Planctomycetota bacterium]